VSQQRILADRQPEVLASAANVPDLPMSQGGSEILRPGEVTPDRARVEDLDVAERTSGHVPGEASPDTLHLWKLWHRRPLSFFCWARIPQGACR
jgi:hypothetical protein